MFRRRAGGRGAAVAATSEAGSSGASAPSVAEGKGGAEAAPTDMSTSENGNNVGDGSNSNNAAEAPSGMHGMASSLLGEMLRGRYPPPSSTYELRPESIQILL